MASEEQAHDGKMSVGEAGRKGGEKVAKERGPEYYSEIGRKGGHSQGKENNPGNFANRRGEGEADADESGG
ncbi:MAG: glucose starvation-inducible protein B [Patescibacteria group bacterium]|nr:glucose starvation-inducible protein B [Patescibacteria group bacterium]MDE1944480.1 glucose starvation-inducible protein B [Patescibacteria group bacterium]MDE1944715.1 glucose starvation-inducible protein B [Patescibacteria group bacterium]MDE2057259.1 glucose starvation-inducible protein B [Patescibacteria group bacterium]